MYSETGQTRTFVDPIGSAVWHDSRVSISGNEEPSVRGEHCLTHTRGLEQLVPREIRYQLRVGAAVRSPRHCSTSGGGGGEEGSNDDETGENGRDDGGSMLSARGTFKVTEYCCGQ